MISGDQTTNHRRKGREPSPQTSHRSTMGRSTRCSTRRRPSLSGPSAMRGRRAGRPTAAATTRESSSRAPGKSSSACRSSAGQPLGRCATGSPRRFPPERWSQIRTNDGIERINREIRRKTRVVGTFPDGNSALMLVTARLKYIVEHERGKRRHLDMSNLDEMDELKGK